MTKNSNFNLQSIKVALLCNQYKTGCLVLLMASRWSPEHRRNFTNKSELNNPMQKPLCLYLFSKSDYSNTQTNFE